MAAAAGTKMAPLPLLSVAVAAAALLLAADLATAAPDKLPPEYKLCQRDDNFISCFEEAFEVAVHQLRGGLPDFGIPSLEPFVIPQLVIGDSNTDAPVNLHINFSDINVYNLPTAKISNIKFDFENLRINAHAQVEKAFAEANYIMDGRILLIPAKGEGKVYLNLTNLAADITINGERHMKKNRDHMKVKDFTFKITNCDKLEMQFDNLFNGDKTLGTSINNLVNENWKEIWSQLESPLEEIFGYTFKEYSRRIFDKVALDDIFLPPSS